MTTCFVCGTAFDTEEELRNHHREMHTRVGLVRDRNQDDDPNEADIEPKSDVGHKVTPRRPK